MGWRRDCYERRDKRGHQDRLQLTCRDEKNFVLEGFVFRPHFFNRYRGRVTEDEQRVYRSDLEIAKIAVHSLSDAEIPERLKARENYKLLVNFHIHGKEERSFGIYHVPIIRDRFDLISGNICAVTILSHDEDMARLVEEGKLIL